jgi:hypothetical protein
MNDTERAQVEMGEDAETFLRTDLGRYIIGRSQQDISDNVEKLIAADPDNMLAIQGIQNKIKLARMLPQYLSELIIEKNQILESREMADDD